MNLEQRDGDDAVAWVRATNARWLVHHGLREDAADYLDHLAAVDPGRLKRSCGIARSMVQRCGSASDPKPWFYAGLFSLATAEEGRRFLAGHKFTRMAIPELAEALGSDFTPDRLGEATWALIECIRVVGGGRGRIGRPMRVFAVRPLQPSARHVYQPAALP